MYNNTSVHYMRYFQIIAFMTLSMPSSRRMSSIRGLPQALRGGNARRGIRQCGMILGSPTLGRLSFRVEVYDT